MCRPVRCFALTEAETYPNMQLNFDHKLQDWSAETGLMTFARYTSPS